MSVTIASVQFEAGPDKARNLDLIGGLVDQAVGRGARLVVLPEAAMYRSGDASLVDKRTAAEGLDGRFVGRLATLAQQHRIHLVAGMAETCPSDERLFNTVVTLDAQGVLIGAYRKVHLYDAFGFRESATTIPGPTNSTSHFDIDGLRFGVMTCYDLRFPESARVLADQGADVLLVPSAWMRGPLKEQQWELLLRARAVENTVYVMGAGQSGAKCIGNSMVVDPMGSIIAGCDGETGTVMACISKDRVTTVRTTNPSLANRRYRVVATEN